MPSTGISGITVDAAGHRIIDKEHRGVRIYVRLWPISEEEAEQRLDAELDRVEAELERRANFRPRFADCAARYLVESQHKRSWALSLGTSDYLVHISARSRQIESMIAR